MVEVNANCFYTKYLVNNQRFYDEKSKSLFLALVTPGPRFQQTWQRSTMPGNKSNIYLSLGLLVTDKKIFQVYFLFNSFKKKGPLGQGQY